MITGSTRVAAVIGDPVRHSLSPVLHNAAYRALGLDWVYVAFEVPDGGASAALQAVRTFDLVGLSVTMPHKTAIAALCDDLTPDAAALRSVNTVTRRPDGTFAGDSTDGEGFLRSLADADPALDISGQVALVLGGGGAARAVALALARRGAHVTVAARRAAAATEAAAQAGGDAIAWSDRVEAALGAGLLVNATPIGMRGRAAAGAETLPVPAEILRPNQVVVDLVYDPLETPLLGAARSRGALAVSGLGMLVHQAALQVEQWTGQAAPVDAMRASVL